MTKNKVIVQLKKSVSDATKINCITFCDMKGKEADGNSQHTLSRSGVKAEEEKMAVSCSTL